MRFLQRGINNKPLEVKQQDNRKLKFSEYGIVKQSEQPKPDSGKALEIARSLHGRREVDHEFLIQNFGR